MHIPDNYLSPQTDAVMAVAMVPVWIHCIKKVRATLDREHMAFLGICAAFSFLLMMFNVPLPGGTTGHAVGGALIALLLGPEAAAIALGFIRERGGYITAHYFYPVSGYLIDKDI